VLYTVSVAVISLQGSLAPIVGMRVPQGIGVAILFTVGPAVVARAFGPERRGTALGVTLGAMGAGQVAGTLGGGWLALNVGWEAIFWARVPFGIAILLLTIAGAPDTARRTASVSSSAFDWAGAAVLFLFLFATVLGLSFARIDGWTAARPITLYILSAALGSAFVWRQRNAASPVFPSALLGSPGFRKGVVSNFLVTVGTFVMWFLFPFFVADVLQRSSVVLGAMLASMAAATLGGAASGGWLADRFGDRRATLSGAVIAAGGALLIGQMSGSSPIAAVAIGAIVIGAGFGVHQAAVYALTLRSVNGRNAGGASAALAVAQTLGTVTSIAVMTTTLSWRESSHIASGSTNSFLGAYGDVMIIAAAVTLAGGLLPLMPLTFSSRR
jgi:MFS family permease